MKAKRVGIIFLAAVVMCMVLELLCLLIPQSAIQKNCEISAEYFGRMYPFPERIPGVRNTTVDLYADCRLLQVIYEMDTDRPVYSAIAAPHFDGENTDVNIDFLEAVYHHPDQNASYGRYWHGSMVYIRPMLLFWNIRQIYKVLETVLIIMALILSISLYRTKNGILAVIFLLSFCLGGGLMMGLCAEYFHMMFLSIMLTLLLLKNREDEKRIYDFAVVSGVLSCFLDFLTTETLTITLPLLIYYMVYREKKDVKIILKAVSVWLFSYGGMFLTKWCLCAVTGGVEPASDIAERIEEYVIGNPFRSIISNMSLLFPVSGMASFRIQIVLSVIVLLLAVVGVTGIMKKEGGSRALCFGILIMIPYVRYMLLSTHSLRHNFFTYRAQIPVVMLLLYGCVRGHFFFKDDTIISI